MTKGCGAIAFAVDMLGRMSSEDKALGLRSSNAWSNSHAAGLRNKHNHIVRYSSEPSYLGVAATWRLDWMDDRLLVGLCG